MRYLMWIFVAMLVLAMPAVAGFDEGVAAYERGDYAMAMKQFRPLADKGVAEAQHNLGMMYRKGLGVPQDFAAARSWFEKAAAQRYVPSWMNLALIYREGLGVEQDYAEAGKWTLAAANKGNAEAQYNLGLFYLNGIGLPRDAVQGYVWSALAAEFYPAGPLRDDALANRNAGNAMLDAAQKTDAERQLFFRRGWAYFFGRDAEGRGSCCADERRSVEQFCRAEELGLVEAKIMLFSLGDPKTRLIVANVAVTGSDPLAFMTGYARRLDQTFAALGKPIKDWPSFCKTALQSPDETSQPSAPAAKQRKKSDTD